MKAIEHSPEAVCGKGCEAIDRTSYEGLRMVLSVWEPQGSRGVGAEVWAAVGAEPQCVDGIESLGVAKHQNGIWREGSSQIHRASAGAFCGNGTSRLVPNDRLRDLTCKEEPVPTGTPLWGLSAVRGIGELIGLTAAQRENKYLSRAVDGPNEREVGAIRMPCRLAGIL